MKKFILGATLIASLCSITTSCGGGEQANVNTDTVISTQLADSISMTMGAFNGANLQQQLQNVGSVDDFIKVYQLIVGRSYTPEELMALNAAIYAVQQIQGMENAGVKIDRNLYLQEFRKNIQNANETTDRMPILYKQAQELGTRLDAILQKREAMRRGISVEQMLAPVDSAAMSQQQPEQVVEQVTETVVEETTAAVPADTAKNANK